MREGDWGLRIGGGGEEGGREVCVCVGGGPVSDVCLACQDGSFDVQVYLCPIHKKNGIRGVKVGTLGGGRHIQTNH